jgi:hypothetical protein
MSKVKVATSSLGCLGLPRLSPTEHDEIHLYVRWWLRDILQIEPIPTFQKEDETADADFFVNNTVDIILGVADAFFHGNQRIRNGNCVSVEFYYSKMQKFCQLDFISIHDQEMAPLFYAHAFGLLSCGMLKDTPFCLGTTELSASTKFGKNFCLTTNPSEACKFLGVPETICSQNYTPTEIYEIISQSPFFDPSTLSFRKKDQDRRVVDGFLKFSQGKPSSRVAKPTFDEALSFFGLHEAYASFVDEEERKILHTKRQAAVKKQLSEVIQKKIASDKIQAAQAAQTEDKKAEGVKISSLFTSFREWIETSKRMSYEEWAQTEPDVEMVFKEFSP